MATNRPLYQHDCKECRFIGQTIGGGKIVDLYVHPSRYTTIIARFGNAGHEYWSTLKDHARPNGHAELWAARCLLAASLDDPNDLCPPVH